MKEEHEKLQKAEQKRQATQAEWRAQWTAIAIDPLLPREMRSWRNQQQALAGTAAEIRDRQTNLDRLSKQIDSLRADLGECLAGLEQPRVCDEFVSTVLDQCQETAESIRNNNQRREGFESQLAELEQQRPEAERQAGEARKELDRWRAEWAEAVAALGLDGDSKPSEANAVIESPDELRQAEDRSKKRQKIESELASVERQLHQQAVGAALDDWITEAEQFDSDQVQADLAQLGGKITEGEREKTEASEAIGSHRNELSRMDGSGRAAEAQIQAEHLLAAIRSDAEQYIRLRLASAVLSRAMERFREASQGPVLSRAAKLFAELTLGSFTSLRVDYDDKGHAVLVGVRPGSGQTVTVDGMSDGTCDQLYLALRLALLESSLDGREPLPFIVDDILIMFDDDRAAAAMKALARLSEKTQVIFFTHHEHLVEIARETVDSNISFARRLNPSTV